MNKLTLIEARPIIARALSQCNITASNTVVADYLNQAQERLMNKGKWVGTMIHYRFCVRSACITLPRQINTVEAFWIDRTPFSIRNHWYEALPNGPGLQSPDCGNGTDLMARDPAPTFDEIDGLNSKLNVISTEEEAADSRILLQGYDENGLWIRSDDNGTMIDGEWVAITPTGTRSVNNFGSVTGVVKPVTNGPIWINQWLNNISSDYKAIAYYEADEKIPIYRRYLIPGISQSGGCNCSSSSTSDPCQTDQTTVTVLAKLRHLPVRNDNDFLIIGNIGALKLMVKSIVHEDNDVEDKAMICESRALKLLDDELSTYDGDGTTVPVAFEDADVYGGSVENVV